LATQKQAHLNQLVPILSGGFPAFRFIPEKGMNNAG